MKYQVRLNKGDDYISDIKTIIDSIKLNGNKAQCHSILVSNSKIEHIELFMNFALEPNSSNPPVKASLNILGFQNDKLEKFIFNTEFFPCYELSNMSQKLKVNGSYKSLGFPLELPKITPSNLHESISILNNYNSKKEIGKDEYDAIARLIISTSEAIRFSSVVNGIKNSIENHTAFTPNSFEIIGWGGHSIAS